MWDGITYPFHTLLGMWLLIHAGIKVTPCKSKGLLMMSLCHTWQHPLLRHWGQETKWPTIYRQYFQLHLLETKLLYFDLNFTYISKRPISNKSALVQVMAWHQQVPSHYLNQWLSSLLMHPSALMKNINLCDLMSLPWWYKYVNGTCNLPWWPLLVQLCWYTLILAQSLQFSFEVWVPVGEIQLPNLQMSCSDLIR